MPAIRNRRLKAGTKNSPARSKSTCCFHGGLLRRRWLSFFQSEQHALRSDRFIYFSNTFSIWPTFYGHSLPLGCRRRSRYRTRDSIVDSPHCLRAWLVPLKVATGDESQRDGRRLHRPSRTLRSASSKPLFHTLANSPALQRAQEGNDIDLLLCRQFRLGDQVEELHRVFERQ